MNDPAAPATHDRRAVHAMVPLALRLARQWWPQLAALAAACGAVAATVTGALGVGDALGRGLTSLAVARLGGIEAAVLSDEFFRAALTDDFASNAGSVAPGSPPVRLVPAIVLEAAVEAAVESAAEPGRRRRGGRAALLGCDDPAALGFTTSGFTPPLEPLEPDAVAVNAVLAESLGLRVGDPIVVRIASRSAVPADSPLGRRTGNATGRRLRVGQVLPPAGLGQFSLRPAQVTQPLVVVSLATVQEILRKGEIANAVFAIPDRPTGGVRDSATITAWLRERLRPLLEDYGLSFESAGASAAGSTPLRLTSRRLILPAEVDRAAEQVLVPHGGQPSLVFLANALTAEGGGGGAPASIPYSTVLGIATTSLPSGKLVDDQGGLLPLPGPDEILIDRWMSDDLAAQGSPIAVGDPLEISFFLPEALHGRIEETSRVFRVSGIAAMRGGAVAPDLVPEVEGVSDEKSIADWDPPFPFDATRVRTTPPHDEDDRYWKEHGTTPKAFVSLETARGLAGSRFGHSTAWHVPRTALPSAADLRLSLANAIRPEPMGLRVVPLRTEALAAARGSTPFGSLFLALSSFVVVAGLLLEWLLFKLLVAARRRDVGILAAIGWSPARITSLLTLVGGLAALVGVAIGTLLGPPWSALLLRALGGSWNAAVARGSSQVFGAAAPSLSAIWPGAVASAAVSLVALAAGARRAGRVPPLTLLRGGSGMPGERPAGRAGVFTIAVAAAGPAAALLAAWRGQAADPRQAVPLFFLSGVAALAGLLALVRLWLGRGGLVRSAPLKSIGALAWRGIAHRPTRAFSVVAIVALAEFLIVAVSSFAIVPSARPGDRESPTGGWTHIVAFGEPTGIDPSDPLQRETLGLTADEQATLAGCTIARLRSNAGDDASCTNLYAPGQPNVLGVGPAFSGRGGFRFVAHAPLPDGVTNPWTLLERDRAAGEARPIPVILDQATAQWALKLGGVGATFTIPGDDGDAGDGKGIRLEIVGLLEPGILQGSVIVAEREFERMFPRRSGYSLALVEAPADAVPVAGQPDHVAEAIVAAWDDAAPSVQTARGRFASLSAVQNTFLAGFQALGTLGLLLGTAGLAAVQLERVLEQRGQLGLLRAIGFGTGRVRSLIVIETLFMVGLGLAVGVLAGGIAILPALASGRAAVPVGWIAATCGLTLAVGLVAGLVAARRAASLALREALQPA